MTRLQADLLAKLDGWRAWQPVAPSRPEAIRRLLVQALSGRCRRPRKD
jgi:hypothetical protein